MIGHGVKFPAVDGSERHPKAKHRLHGAKIRRKEWDFNYLFLNW